jgi:hypothetical protein
MEKNNIFRESKTERPLGILRSEITQCGEI